MIAIAVILAVLGLAVWRMERTHRRRPHPRTRSRGGAPDRDAERVRAELRAVPHDEKGFRPAPRRR